MLRLVLLCKNHVLPFKLWASGESRVVGGGGDSWAMGVGGGGLVNVFSTTVYFKFVQDEMGEGGGGGEVDLSVEQGVYIAVKQETGDAFDFRGVMTHGCD